MVTSSLVLDDVLARVAQGIGEALDVWECDLYEYSAEQNTLTAKAAWVLEPTKEDEEWVGTVVDLVGRPSYHAVLHEGRLTEDHLDDPDVDAADRALMERWGELSTLSVPLRFRDEVIGCLVLVEKRRVRRFTDEEKELLRELAVPAAIAIHNARMFLRQQEQTRFLASLLDSSKAITSTVVLEDVLQMVARKAAEALSAQEVSIYEYDQSPRRDQAGRRLLRAARPGEEACPALGREFVLDEWPTNRRVIETGEPVQETVSDPATDPAARAVMLKYGQQSTLTVPFFLDSRPVGMIELVETAYERRFTEAEIELARSLGEQAAVAIANAKLFQREELRNKTARGPAGREPFGRGLAQAADGARAPERGDRRPAGRRGRHRRGAPARRRRRLRPVRPSCSTRRARRAARATSRRRARRPSAPSPPSRRYRRATRRSPVSRCRSCSGAPPRGTSRP